MVRALLLSFVVLVTLGCGPKKPPAGNIPRPASGPFYSTVPCADQCGTDTNCANNCTTVTNQQPLPGGLRH